jgi:tetratricopeptide (TPR) repeat protein
MGSKAVMVTVPVVAFLYEVVFISRSAGVSLRQRWFLYLAFFASTWLLWRVGVIGGLYLRDQGNPITVGFAMEGLTPWQYACTQPAVILHYLRLALWPSPLCIDYSWPVAKRAMDILPAAVFLLALLAAAGWAMVKRPPLGFVATAFFLILAPTSSVVPIKDIAFEHRMYLPLACVIIVVVAAAAAAINAMFKSRKAQRVAAALAVGAAALALGIATYQRNALYGDPVELWSRNVALTPNSPRPVNALGFALFKKKRNAEALATLRRAAELDPYYAGAFANMGMVYWSERNAAEAVKQFRKAVEISPYEFGAELYYCYGSALLALGALDEAIQALRDAVECEPDHYEAHYNLGNAYSQKGLRDEAIAAYREAIRGNAGYTEAWVNLGLAFAGAGRIAESEDAYRNALGTISPQTAPDAVFKAHYNLGRVLSGLGRTREAREHFTAAIRIKPDHAGARSALQTTD